MDRYRALEVFRTVAELSSFAGAARALGLSPAAVSKNIVELERHLGIRLVHRTTRRLALTEEGRIYLEQVIRGLDTLSEAEQAVIATTADPVGTLRVSAPMTVGLTRLTTAIPAFLARFPGLKLDLHLDDRRVDLIKDRFDLVIRGSAALDDSSMIAKKLAVMKHALCGAPSYFERHGRPLVPADLRSHNCIRFGLSGHASSWEFQKAGQAERIVIEPRYSVTSSLAVRDALRAGFGVSLIPYPYVAEDIDAGRLQTALDDWQTVETTVYAIYPARQHLPSKVRAFIEFVSAEFQRT